MIDLEIHDILHEATILALDEGLQGFQFRSKNLIFVVKRLLVFLHLFDVRRRRSKDDGFARLGWRRQILDISTIAGSLILLERGNDSSEGLQLGVERFAVFALDLVVR